MTTILEQYRIADFLEWNREKKLVLNPHFQRGSVWSPAARSYLIDTILRQLPTPKIYLRTNVDVLTKRSIREVVDGQQRLRAIIDFADDKFSLNKRAKEFAGQFYSMLPPELQQTFLSYPIAVDQLLNANDEDVLEVFARLNSYSVQLNDAEKRHARYQGDFKWAIYEASRRWPALWEKYKIVTVRQRVRMLDDSLMAEMFGILIDGIKDGGQSNISKLYARLDSNFDAEGDIPRQLDRVLGFFIKELADDLDHTPLLNSPHFLMLFAALSHALVGIPAGDLGDKMPERQSGVVLSDIHIVRNNLLQLAAIIDADQPTGGFENFWRASKSSTQRIASRATRFPYYYGALFPLPIENR